MYSTKFKVGGKSGSDLEESRTLPTLNQEQKKNGGNYKQ